MNWKKTLPYLLIALLIFTACGRDYSAAPEAARYDAPAEAAVEFEMVMEESESAGLAFSSDSAMQDLDVPQQERLIIRTADMSIVVVDTEEAMGSISDMVNENGGWVVSSNVFQYDENAKTGNMTVRIPAEGFDMFLEAIGLMAVEVTNISTFGQDVTEEFVDLSSRLRNLEETADRVRNFMDETKNVEEALAVNQELSRLESEIEVIKGRMQYLEQSSAFSTVSINLTPDILSQPIEVGGWQPQGVAKSALESLISTLQTFVDIIIWFTISVLPILLIVGIPLWLVIRFFVRRRRRRKESAVQEQGELPEPAATQGPDAIDEG